MDPSSGASVYFIIQGVPGAQAEALTKWAANTSVRFEISEDPTAGSVSLLVERKHASTVQQLKRALRKLFHRSKCKVPPDLPHVEALATADAYQAASTPVADTEGSSQIPPTLKTATVALQSSCAMAALEGAEIVPRLPAGFDKVARERYLQLRLHVPQLGH